MTESLKLMLGTGFLTLALSANPFSVQASNDEGDDKVTIEDVKEAAGGMLTDEQAAALAAKSNELGDKEATAEDVIAVLGDNADPELIKTLLESHNEDAGGDNESEKASDGNHIPTVKSAVAEDAQKDSKEGDDKGNDGEDVDN